MRRAAVRTTADQITRACLAPNFRSGSENIRLVSALRIRRPLCADPGTPGRLKHNRGSRCSDNDHGRTTDCMRGGAGRLAAPSRRSAGWGVGLGTGEWGDRARRSAGHGHGRQMIGGLWAVDGRWLFRMLAGCWLLGGWRDPRRGTSYGVIADIGVLRQFSDRNQCQTRCRAGGAQAGHQPASRLCAVQGKTSSPDVHPHDFPTALSPSFTMAASMSDSDVVFVEVSPPRHRRRRRRCRCGPRPAVLTAETRVPADRAWRLAHACVAAG